MKKFIVIACFLPIFLMGQELPKSIYELYRIDNSCQLEEILQMDFSEESIEEAFYENPKNKINQDSVLYYVNYLSEYLKTTEKNIINKKNIEFENGNSISYIKDKWHFKVGKKKNIKKFDYVKHFSKYDGFIGKNENQVSWNTKDGKQILFKNVEFAKPIKDNIFLVQNHLGYGIYKGEKEIISPNFKKISINKKSGYYECTQWNRKKTIIDETGVQLIDELPGYTRISGNYISLLENIYSLETKKFIECDPDISSSFVSAKHDIFKVRRKGESYYFLCDSKGNIIFEKPIQNASMMKNSLIKIVIERNNIALYDTKLNEVISLQKHDDKYLSSKLIILEDKESKLLSLHNLEGKEISQDRYKQFKVVNKDSIVLFKENNDYETAVVLNSIDYSFTPFTENLIFKRTNKKINDQFVSINETNKGFQVISKNRKSDYFKKVNFHGSYIVAKRTNTETKKDQFSLFDKDLNPIVADTKNGKVEQFTFCSYLGNNIFQLGNGKDYFLIQEGKYLMSIPARFYNSKKISKESLVVKFRGDRKSSIINMQEKKIHLKNKIHEMYQVGNGFVVYFNKNESFYLNKNGEIIFENMYSIQALNSHIVSIKSTKADNYSIKSTSGESISKTTYRYILKEGYYYYGMKINNSIDVINPKGELIHTIEI